MAKKETYIGRYVLHESIEGEPSTPKRINWTKRRLDRSGADYAADEDDYDYDEIVCSMKKDFTNPKKDRDNVKLQQDMNFFQVKKTLAQTGTVHWRSISKVSKFTYT